MNVGRVVIQNAFGSLENRWRILKHFDFRDDKTSPIIIVCCVLYNYCEMWGALKPRLANTRIKGDNLMGFGVNRLLIVRKGEQAKVEGERLRIVLFEKWMIDQPIVP
jgi:hypothetical protein